jgi:molybdopterin-guanine dinucleotide biosynthesis protein A
MVSCDRWECKGLQSQLVMDHIEAFILAGGASSRMGSDKSQLLINDHSFIEHIADTLFKVTNSVTIVGHHSDDTRLRVAIDVYPKWGALGGIHGALNACQADWAFVVACDMPFISPELIQLLAHQRNQTEAVVPIQPDGRPQPLCAFYRLDPCLSRATQLIESGHRRPLDLLNSVTTRWVSFAELEDLDQSQNFFVNINTPEDYYEATQRAAAHKS